jgi:hypothetical protein
MKKRKNKAKAHNAILWIITYIAFFLFVLAGSCLDSDSWIPHIVVLVSLVWLWCFAKANEERR